MMSNKTSERYSS